MRLSDFVSAEQMNALHRPTGLAEGLPAGVYSEGFYRLENDMLFAKTWAAVAVNGDIPEPGRCPAGDARGVADSPGAGSGSPWPAFRDRKSASNTLRIRSLITSVCTGSYCSIARRVRLPRS